MRWANLMCTRLYNKIFEKCPQFLSVVCGIPNSSFSFDGSEERNLADSLAGLLNCNSPAGLYYKACSVSKAANMLSQHDWLCTAVQDPSCQAIFKCGFILLWLLPGFLISPLLPFAFFIGSCGAGWDRGVQELL